MSLFIIYSLACIGAHRIWNFEDIFAGARGALQAHARLKAFWCQACNAFWVCFLLALTLPWADKPAVLVFLSSLAAYGIVRLALWSYKIASHAEALIKRKAAPEQSRAPTRVMPIAAPTEAAKCLTCAEKKEAAKTAQQAVLKHKRRVVILTTLSDFAPGYSLATCVLEQARMLAAREDWLVQVWIHERSNLASLPNLPWNVEVRQIIPQAPWIPDALSASDSTRLENVIRANLLALGNATVITHDALFQAGYVSLARAIHRIGKLPGFAWLHTCHSNVGTRPPLQEPTLWRCTLPDGHKLLCLNEAMREPLARYYATSVDNVLVCPNSRDITTFGAFDERAAQIIKRGGLLSADVVQVYPISATRLMNKGVHTVIRILAKLAPKRTCKLVIAAAHANATEEREALAACRTLGVSLGLPPDFLVVSSELLPDTASQGLGQTAVRDLFRVSNVFFFPTESEASSLVAIEAALSGCLMVLNARVNTLHTMFPPDAVMLADLAPDALGALEGWETVVNYTERYLDSPANTAKRHALKAFSHEAISAQLIRLIEREPLAPMIRPGG